MTKRFHRIRYYPHAWSNFDQVEPCKKPKPCLGCEFRHPFCDENGVLAAVFMEKKT